MELGRDTGPVSKHFTFGKPKLFFLNGDQMGFHLFLKWLTYKMTFFFSVMSHVKHWAYTVV